MKKILATAALALAVSLPAAASATDQKYATTYSVQTPDGAMLVLSTTDCKLALDHGPHTPALHAALYIRYHRLYRGCWYTPDNAPVPAFRIVIPEFGGWFYAPQSRFLEQQN
jgi:hypothetical protein